MTMNTVVMGIIVLLVLVLLIFLLFKYGSNVPNKTACFEAGGRCKPGTDTSCSVIGGQKEAESCGSSAKCCGLLSDDDLS